MKLKTHKMINSRLCGEVVDVTEGRGTTRFCATEEMIVDEHGLIHGGFVFGLADHAAMVAVNDPKVVLGSADVRFVAPVALGEIVEATAIVIESRGRKRVVEVTAAVGDRDVLRGTMTAFVLESHVLDR